MCIIIWSVMWKGWDLQGQGHGKGSNPKKIIVSSRTSEAFAPKFGMLVYHHDLEHPPKTECGCRHGRVIENGRTRNHHTLWTVWLWVRILGDPQSIHLRNPTSTTTWPGVSCEKFLCQGQGHNVGKKKKKSWSSEPSRSRFQCRLKSSKNNVFPFIYYIWTSEPFVRKFGIVVHHHEPVCCVTILAPKMECGCPSGREIKNGHIIRKCHPYWVYPSYGGTQKKKCDNFELLSSRPRWQWGFKSALTM